MAITIFPTPPIVVSSANVTDFPLSGAGNLRVDVAIEGVDIGQGTLDNSLPVALAFDQDVAVRPTGQLPMSQSVSVALAVDQPVIPVSFPPAGLAPNAAQETGGNLTAINISTQYVNQLVELMSLVLLELRAMNWQLANITGANPDMSTLDQQLN